ncbi:MAG TPA: hypothetical protein ENK16_09120 [Chromatiales bacterium]|nr:hypothetical protein [Chromatiales bacterium]
MQPFIVILGVLLGTLVSLSFGLGVVLFVFWFLQSESSRFSTEMPYLLTSTAIFTALSVVCATAFIGCLRQRRWRYPVLALLWAGLIVTGWYYWP